jgi:hypothetical protein
VIDVLSFPSPDWSRGPKPRRVRRALALDEHGRIALDRGDLDGAERLFIRAIETNALLANPWFNLGLVYKSQRRWTEAAACNRQAIERGTSQQDPAFWNLGIAATALRDWDTARMAWRGYGIEIPGDGPPNGDFGVSPVRINPETSGEVVWGRRIDPARIVLENIPLPGSGHRWRDVEDRFREAGWAIEDWTATVRRLCKDCSLDSVESHNHGPFMSTVEGSHVGLAAPRDIAETILASWTEGHPHRTRTDLIPVET